ncbi:DUF98 domain-containing protein [Chloroflexi bacterium TSY]|nr:DUF98 domain-containing protein [Chloroflexi bacterium TSY]
MQILHPVQTESIEKSSQVCQLDTASIVVSPTESNLSGTAKNTGDARTQNDSYDPFADLMLVQDERPLQLTQIDLRTLSPYQRALLAIDGTVTKFIEAYMLEPVEVTLLKQETQPLSQDHPWLAASAQVEVVAREVLLRGRYSGTTYAYAVSLLMPERLSQDMLQQLRIEPSGIGRVLLNSQIENRREILWYGHEVIDELPPDVQACIGNAFISRTYRIIANGKPTMLISEKFPINSAAY